MCTVCPVLHCIGNHLNALHSFDHLNEFYPMASSNSEPSGEGNHNDDAEEEADDVSKCRIKPSIVDTNLSENLIKRRRQFYYNHVRSIYSQILSKKIATKRKSSSTCKPALLLVCWLFQLNYFQKSLGNRKITWQVLQNNCQITQVFVLQRFWLSYLGLFKFHNLKVLPFFTFFNDTVESPDVYKQNHLVQLKKSLITCKFLKLTWFILLWFKR